MTAAALPRLAPLRTVIVALGSALAGGLVALALLGLVRSGDAQHTQAHSPIFRGAGFSIAVPSGWTAHALSSGVVLQRAGGVVIVRRTGPVRGDLRFLARGLTAQLSRAIPGFHLVGARLGRVRAGGAFLYTFASAGKAHALALTRVGGTTYRIDSVVAAGSPETARQAGAAVASFGP